MTKWFVELIVFSIAALGLFSLEWLAGLDPKVWLFLPCFAVAWFGTGWILRLLQRTT